MNTPTKPLLYADLFDIDELIRLATYREAVRAGFYTDSINNERVSNYRFNQHWLMTGEES